MTGGTERLPGRAEGVGRFSPAQHTPVLGGVWVPQTLGEGGFLFRPCPEGQQAAAAQPRAPTTSHVVISLGDINARLIFSMEHFARRRGFDSSAEIKIFDDEKLSSLERDTDIRGVME